MRILLCADACCQSTCYYYERAFRVLKHDVVTFGPLFTVDDILEWKSVEDRYCAFSAVEKTQRWNTLRRLRQHRDYISTASPMPVSIPNIDVDLIIWIDSGPHRLRLTGLDRIDIPSIGIIGDVRGQLKEQIAHARQFNHVFVQFTPSAIPAFKEAGISNVSWLPPAADEDLHYHQGNVEPIYDIGFIGSISPWHQRRVRLLGELRKNFDVLIGSAIHHEMALMYKRCKIVFNCSLDGDINMRVPEGMISGRPLVTDYVEGLNEFGVYYQEYYTEESDEQLIKAITYLLKQDQYYRDDLAQGAYNEIIGHHTYKHRAIQVLEIVS